MGFLEAVTIYFSGEKGAAIGAGVVGVALVAAGLYFWRGYGGGLGAGMGISLLVVGVAAVGGGIGLYAVVDKRADELARTFEEDAAAPVSAEITRMEKVNANWSRLKIAWVILIAGALASLMFVKRDWVTGVALTVLLLAAALTAFDTFAERRAEIYSGHLEEIRSSQ